MYGHRQQDCEMNARSPNEHGEAPQRRRHKMLRTTSGFPIVDGKYLDLETDEIKT
jgi:hypothetical protein